jgi:hypothetical protein
VPEDLHGCLRWAGLTWRRYESCELANSIIDMERYLMKRGLRPRLWAIALGITMAIVVAGPAEAAQGNPGVMPPQSHPHGATYGQWNARWWQWLYQTPVNINPEFSPAGTADAPAAVDCSAGQSDHVWFIGGTFLPTSSNPQIARSDVYRTCSIPTGTFLFFPILNTESDNLSCQTNTTFTAEQLRAAAKLGIDDIVPGSMSATIDGAPVAGLEDGYSVYRSPSPWFSYTLPASNVGQLPEVCGKSFPAGTQPPPVDGHAGATADGIYLMLRPLSPGIHTVHFGGELNVPGTPAPAPPAGPVDFVQNINYTITVTPK